MINTTPAVDAAVVEPADAVLEVSQLCVGYGPRGGRAVRVVEDVDISLHRNETVALVGESGSGKTTVARAIMGLVGAAGGEVTGAVRLGGRDLLGATRRELSDIRGRDIAMIFQEPQRSLNPAYTVGDQIAEAVRRHTGASRKQAWRQAIESMGHVRIPSAERLAHKYPFEFSGGMCQRVMIAMAIVCQPTVLIADEPTTALDVTVQAQVLDLLKELQREMGLAMLFITHDLGVVADVADYVKVLYAGQVVEAGSAEQVFFSPRHPYTAGLLASIPTILSDDDEFRSIPGRVPTPGSWAAGCRFAPRCAHRVENRCDEPIALRRDAIGEVRCARLGELTLLGVPR
jgi:peptide/nickel transport system ATP-binding protein/oligopeptide transport system ATP-binding protein